MKAIITNPVALQYNWIGSRGKHSFEQLKLSQTICGKCFFHHFINSHLVCDPTIRQPGFDLPRQQWSLLNRFRAEQGHCSACRRKRRLTDTDLCPCGETQTMSHTVESCPLIKLNGGLSQLYQRIRGVSQCAI